jgi:hypothetical protein
MDVLTASAAFVVTGRERGGGASDGDEAVEVAAFAAFPTEVDFCHVWLVKILWVSVVLGFVQF